MYGAERVEKRTEPSITRKPVVCPVCKQNNPTGFLFCFNYNQPLTNASAKTAEPNKVLDLIVADDELRHRFDVLLEMAYKREYCRQFL